MATKRSPPKDLEDASVHLKQPRLDVPSQVPAFVAKSIQSNQGPHIPVADLSSPPPPPFSAQPTSMSSSPQVATGFGVLSPGRSSLGIHSSRTDTSLSSCVPPIVTSQDPPKVAYAYQQAPSFVASVGIMQQKGYPPAQLVHSRPTVAGTHTLVNNSSMAASVLPVSSPLYFTPNTSDQMTTVVPGNDSLLELTCSSPSQFLHPPTSVCIPSSTSAPPDNRQPVCLSETQHQTKYKVESDVDHRTMKLKVLKYRRAKLASLKLKHEVDLKEKFFLETGGNMMDIVTWKKKPSSKRDAYLKLNDIDSETTAYTQVFSSDSGQLGDEDKQKLSTAFRRDSVTHKTESKAVKKSSASSKLEGPEESSITSTTIQIPLSTISPGVCGGAPSSPLKTPQLPPSPRPVTRLNSSLSSIYETSHEDIVMRARHEAEVMRAISELRKEGLWSASRLPKVQEPQRLKTHWDYLLEEMQWLATDFANERRWKINAAKKICRSVSGYYRELEMQQVRSEKEEALRLRKIASSIAKEVKHFWDSIQKVVEHKQQLLLEEKRKKAMDMHLDFIVDQTTKYSNWLVKGLTATSSTVSPSEPSLHNAATSIHDSDAFLTPDETSDDEETIENEELLVEKEDGNPNYASEIQALQEEGEMPLEQLLASLPPEILKEEPHLPESMEAEEEDSSSQIKVSSVDETMRSSSAEEGLDSKLRPKRSSRKSGGALQDSGKAFEGADDSSDTSADQGCDDEEFKIDVEEEENESTLDEQETHEGQVDHADELKALNEEGDLPLEELLKMYNLQQQSTVAESEGEIDDLNEPIKESSVSSQCSEEDKGSESSSAEEESGDEENMKESLEFLVSGKRIEEVCQTEAGFSDVAAVAEQFQPKGITLATTEVKTKIPFLLKHKLREYQHIGLDWLVAMHDKRLNGILADEMGLGKTIQTIALLAHLACEKAMWGPHLIVVPTSVMLNWEYELKKWCPAFKILTYFGSFKERKLKRVGWTKRNAFHVCITSYNIAVTDHRAFKQMKWKYLILDEAQNIKNFKSQRWQTLLTFNSQRRLLLTGTPLQNNLMELWSLMHFLMPTVFSSHSDFREWFSNPLTGMVEGSQEYNDSIVRRLHQVLRPFLLRRLKMEVEKQMPRKYEHVVLCRLSKRQRFLYDEYMSRRKTKDTLAAGNYLSVINILMQLRKVCNHPDLFEPRPIVSPLRLTALEFYTASLFFTVFEHEPFKHVSLDYLNLQLASYELCTEAFAAFRSRQLQAPRGLIFDPTRSQVDLHLAGGLDDDEEEEEGKTTNSFLKDLHLPNLACSREEWTLSRRRHIHEVNSRRCRRIPMYGIDLVQAVSNICSPSSCQAKFPQPYGSSHWLWSGYVTCLRHQTCISCWEECSPAINNLLTNYDRRALELEEILKRFIITVPSVTAPQVTLHTHLHSPTSHSQDIRMVEEVATNLNPRSTSLHCASTSMCLQFPETRLIQYDCGKLQTLDILLHNLKADSHRVLIFTQMARVLDILEIFLNYHGHTYLRLDGATPVQKRQALMDRFNRDERIFCFILSTRSGGLGVNLTGADTVVFYDSDWNPTMDAQAQDRCHRIGQTRDVHIYRLVCESTIEENILKKANQKRMLGDIAIEGGVFTTDFFKEATLRDLFKAQQEVVPYESSEDIAHDQQTETLAFSPKQIEDLLMQAEDESDAKAASKAKAEQVAEKAEFDEGFCTQVDSECAIDGHTDIDSSSKAMNEFTEVESQLSGVERYAMRYLEEANAEFAAEQLKIAEESIEQAKKSWELSHLQSLREEEERIAEEDVDDEMLLTYDRPELANKIFIDKVTCEEMAVWLPPTPPADGTEDYYVDVALDLAYDTSTTITPAELASVAPYSEEDYDVLGLSRHYPEAEPIKKSQKSYSKQTLKEHINVPPSLFWRRYAIDTLSTKLKKLASHQKKLKAKDQFSPLLEQQPEGPEWSHREDWLLLKGVMEVLEFPLSLAITVPAQMPNWSIIADLISLLSKIRRSPLQCREHLMNVVIPREETNVKGDDTVESKKYKTKDNASKKPKSRKEQKTKNVVIGDNGVEQTSLFTASFDKVLDVTSKRKQASKFTLDSVQKLSTHADLLKEYGIQVDTVLSPMQIAHQRAERIQSELPRHSSQVHQLLAQPYHFSLMRGYAAAAAAAVGAPFMKQSVAGYNLPRQVPGNIAVTTTSVQRFPSVSSTSSSSQLPTNTTIVSQGVLPVSSQFISTSISTSSNSTQPSTPAPLVPAKTFSVASDISKTLRGNITHQQLLLLRQSTLQQQATGNRSQSSTQVARPVIAQPQATPSVQSPTTTIAQKVALPTGIEQLRASLSLPAAPRFPAITSGNSVGRGLTGGRTLQTEDVLALLKQQSLRITATQSFKTGHAVSSQLHSQTPFQFRPESGHLTTKVPSNSNNVVPLDAVKLVSSTNTSTASTTDVVQTQLKAEPTAEQNQSAVGIFAKQQQQVQSQSVAVPFSTPAVSATLSQPTARVTTAAAQNLMKLQQALAQQQQIQKARGSPLPKSTTQ